MTLDDCRSLQEDFLQSLAPLEGAVVMAASASLPSRPLHRAGRTVAPRQTLAVGIARKKRTGGYRLAVRVSEGSLLDLPQVDALRKRSAGEVDALVVGKIFALSGADRLRGTVRPLESGLSIGHFNVTAGTLGAFVFESRDESRTPLILSNNHVLADVNRGRRGDAILQPGYLDGGRQHGALIGELARFRRIQFSRANRVDAALACIADGVEFEPPACRGVVLEEDLFDENLAVQKAGRTTGRTRGVVTAVEVSGVEVSFGMGQVARFDGQIEIQSEDEEPFSAGGDSGSLILTEDRLAAALLFAGSESGGDNGQGVTYANPMHRVLEEMKVKFVSG